MRSNRLLAAAFALAAFGCAHKPALRVQDAPSSVPEKAAVSSETFFRKAVKERAARPRVVPSLPAPATLYFGVNVDTLTTLQKAKMVHLSTALKRFPSASVAIAGYADTTGRARYNLELSARRARSVLFALGGDSLRFKVIGHGETPGPLEAARKVVITISP